VSTTTAPTGIYVGPAITRFLDRLTDTVVTGAGRFWRWLNRSTQPVPADEPAPAAVPWIPPALPAASTASVSAPYVAHTHGVVWRPTVDGVWRASRRGYPYDPHRDRIEPTTVVYIDPFRRVA
jgi:hypothetical protein